MVDGIEHPLGATSIPEVSYRDIEASSAQGSQSGNLDSNLMARIYQKYIDPHHNVKGHIRNHEQHS